MDQDPTPASDIPQKMPTGVGSKPRKWRNLSPLSQMHLAPPAEASLANTIINSREGGKKDPGLDLSSDTRSDFEIVYDMSRSSESSAIQQLATVLCRDDVAGMKCRLERNMEEFNETIVATKAQVKKLKDMEMAWPSNLPDDSNEYYAKLLAGNDKKLNESIKYLEELKKGYEVVRRNVEKMRGLKGDRKKLLREQNFMKKHDLSSHLD